MSMTANSNEARNLALAHRYLEAIERNEADTTIAEFLHPDIIQEEFPNRLLAKGQRRDRAAMLTSYKQGQQLIQSQRYEVITELAAGERVVLEVLWTGTLAVTLNEQLPAGFTMRARLAVFMDFRDDQIVAQRNYDCFDPW